MHFTLAGCAPHIPHRPTQQHSRTRLVGFGKEMEMERCRYRAKSEHSTACSNTRTPIHIPKLPHPLPPNVRSLCGVHKLLLRLCEQGTRTEAHARTCSWRISAAAAVAAVAIAVAGKSRRHACVRFGCRLWRTPPGTRELCGTVHINTYMLCVGRIFGILL